MYEGWENGFLFRVELFRTISPNSHSNKTLGIAQCKFSMPAGVKRMGKLFAFILFSLFVKACHPVVIDITGIVTF